MEGFDVSMCYERKMMPIEVTVRSAGESVFRGRFSVDHHEAKQVVQERAELIKYSSLQQLAKTLDMYDDLTYLLHIQMNKLSCRSNVRLTNDDLIEADDDVSRS